MITATVDLKPYTVEYIPTPFPERAAGVGRLNYHRGKIRGLTTPVRGLVLTGDLRGRAEDQLIGVTVAHSLPASHQQGGLPNPRQCLTLLTGEVFADPLTQEECACGDVGPVWRAFTEETAGVIGIAGPHDRWPNGQTKFVLDGQIRWFNGIKVAGISGAVGNSRELGLRLGADYLRLVSELLTFSPHLILLRESPELSPTQPGWTALADLIHAADFPGLVVCGGTAWREPLAVCGSTTVINVHSRVVTLQTTAG